MNLGNTEKSTSGHHVGLGQEDFFTVICGDDDEGVQQQFANSRVRPMFRDVSWKYLASLDWADGGGAICTFLGKCDHDDVFFTLCVVGNTCLPNIVCKGKETNEENVKKGKAMGWLDGIVAYSDVWVLLYW